MSDVLTSASFQEKAYLLVLGAVLTGVLVPFVKYWMDHNTFLQQKVFEANIARQAELIKARTQFLRDIVDPLWQFQLLALQVSYYAHTEEKYAAAVKAYDEESWMHLKKIRALVGGARWFTTDRTFEQLTSFIDSWLLHDLDAKLMRLILEGRDAEWTRFNQWLYRESCRRTDELVIALAEEYGLSPQTVFSVDRVERNSTTAAMPANSKSE